MKIEISSKEYRDLLDILHMADAVMSGHRKEADKRTAPHRALIQKLYGLAKGEGLDRLISRDAVLNKYIPTPDFEHDSPAHPALHEFGNHLFWDELVNRLTIRDAAQMAGGKERLNTLSARERQQMDGPIRQRYVQEFATNGVSRLEIFERFSGDDGVPAMTSD
ncbi:MAG: hypothetical protein A2X56_06715 [Nitrospirae bacterium GWC2_57_13]|jgi:hypothetical protein|nr:MAG: hypothetical protein A2072_07405 [Nitrospirae bacterium GWC1_57_7]OGW29990.1 MAG: hypothetical protein A2X56_06715 [Nitrospirae bacterium GWC2_57_13]HAR45102.1 hypothetical protein [Nitrospiraceae bacterium]